jgi:hypothetical protein
MEKKTSAAVINSFKKADAFLNIAVRDAAGQWHQVGGVPLHLENPVHTGMIDNKDAKFKIKSYINVIGVDTKDKPPVQF